MFGKKVTLQYPEERPVIPDNYRGVPTLVKDPNGREKCVSCQLCEFVRPPKAIRITPGEFDVEADPERHQGREQEPAAPAAVGHAQRSGVEGGDRAGGACPAFPPTASHSQIARPRDGA